MNGKESDDCFKNEYSGHTYDDKFISWGRSRLPLAKANRDAFRYSNEVCS